MFDRYAALIYAHDKGIKTWVSCEPVLSAGGVLRFIEAGDMVDKFAIEKLNYHLSKINWAQFGKLVIERCEEFG